MCGRFAITLPDDAMAQAFAARPANDLPPSPRYNICPTQPVATVISRAGQRHLGPMRWGFLPHWYGSETDGPLLINARAETIAEKPAFRAAARSRRCLIPASGFYEWTKDDAGNRLPWYIRPAQGDMLAFAGVWQVWERDATRHVTCAIVTCTANDTMAQIHHRMPVILPPEDWPLWLGEAGHGAARLMRPAPEGALHAHRVDARVNSNRADGAELIEPV
ncbi:MAG: SOS response-associated peptidase [Rhodobacteraceae bacterium]|nr:SOS response-associated peptidase [Paracoccaceae bacterium]TVR44828.1 MAG: SOS response-associated peptidase [Paracoccaceae bacterium]